MKITDQIDIANHRPIVLIGGINVLESLDLAREACAEYLRVTRKLAKDARIDFYAAIATFGKANVDDQNGGGRYSNDYNIGPALGATLVLDF